MQPSGIYQLPNDLLVKMTTLMSKISDKVRFRAVNKATRAVLSNVDCMAAIANLMRSTTNANKELAVDVVNVLLAAAFAPGLCSGLKQVSFLYDDVSRLDSTALIKLVSCLGERIVVWVEHTVNQMKSPYTGMQNATHNPKAPLTCQRRRAPGCTNGILGLDLKMQFNYCTDLEIEAALHYLSTMTDLKHLILSSNHIGPALAPYVRNALSKLTRIEYLDLSRNYIGIFPFGSNMPCFDIQQWLSHDLSMMTNLKHLILSSNHIGPALAPYVKNALSKLTQIEYLDLSDNKIGAEGAKELNSALLKLDQLKYLDLSDMDLQTEGVKELTTGLLRLKDLEYLDLSKNVLIFGSGIKKLLEELPTLKNLKHLDLSWFCVKSEIVPELNIALSQLKNLEHLNLSWNSLGSSVIILFTEALPQLKSLKHLNLRYIGLKHADNFELTKALTGALSNLENLEYLDLSDNDLDPCITESLANAMPNLKESSPWQWR